MNEQNKYPKFYQPSETGYTLSPEESRQGYRIFNDTFDNYMLRYMSDVKQFHSIKDRPTANLLQRIVVDGQSYTLNLKDASQNETKSSLDEGFRASEITLRDISIQRTEGGRGREYLSYRLGPDNVVRRWDGGDVTAKREKERELGIEKPIRSYGKQTNEELGKLMLSGLEDLIKYNIPNSRLEEDFGLNKQPVPNKELLGLREFMERATIVG